MNIQLVSAIHHRDELPGRFPSIEENFQNMQRRAVPVTPGVWRFIKRACSKMAAAVMGPSLLAVLAVPGPAEPVAMKWSEIPRSGFCFPYPPFWMPAPNATSVLDYRRGTETPGMEMVVAPGALAKGGR